MKQYFKNHINGFWSLRLFSLICVMFCMALSVSGCGMHAGQSGTKQTAPSFANSATENAQEQTKKQEENFDVSSKDYYDSDRQIKTLGLQIYKSIKGDSYTDKPKKGNVYLVLFLSVYNMGTEKIYFNPYQVVAKVDGKEYENTFLLNEPKNYKPIFTNVAPNETEEGFIVWEVPKNWENFVFEYHGFESEDGGTVKMQYTKDDIAEPYEYVDRN